jgi:hypothetical protein
MWVHPTVTASTRITQVFGGRKVRCHREAVEINLMSFRIGLRAREPRGGNQTHRNQD